MRNAPLYGSDLFGNPTEPTRPSVLSERFLVPPFSVLSARDGWWQERKRAWLTFGIESELGRDAKVFGTLHSWMAQKAGGERGKGGGISVFDPVLCELVYRWFCPGGGQIVDPFAGGSVRGVVAHLLGYKYWGCDLREAQIAANRQQGRTILPDNAPTWVCADALEATPAAPAADLVFTCPPYGDLERYSDDPRDLSQMDYHAFLKALSRVILRCYGRLLPNRFAAIVVGDFRDRRTGFFRGFVGDTVSVFRDCGFSLYNDAILLTPAGSLPIRATQFFEKSRKLGKTHQNVLIFVKGDAGAATAACAGGMG